MTLYFDRIREVWRVKQGPGRRDDIKLKAGDKHKWAEVVDIVKKLPQAT